MNLRKEVREKNLKAWRKQAPARIESPLQFIANRTNSRNEDGSISFSPYFKAAKMAARIGAGNVVNNIARQVAAMR